MSRFERFTERARRALFYARVAVSRHGGQSIRDVHLVLGLVKAAPDVLARLNVDSESVESVKDCLRAQIASAERPSVCVEVPFDEAVSQILDDVVMAADAGRYREITPEHLLFAVLRHGGDAATCLRQIGIDADALESLLPATFSPRQSSR